MGTREAVAKRILNLCEERKVTPNGISYIAGVPQSTVKSILNGESKNPGTVTIKKFVTDSRSLWENFFQRPNLIIWNRR